MKVSIRIYGHQWTGTVVGKHQYIHKHVKEPRTDKRRGGWRFEVFSFRAQTEEGPLDRGSGLGPCVKSYGVPQ